MPRFKVRVPVQLKKSHSVNEAAFQGTGHLALAATLQASHIKCLGIDIEEFELDPNGQDHANLKFSAEFDEESQIYSFLEKLELGLSAHIGSDPSNGYYGTNYIEFDLFNADVQQDATAGALHFSEKFSMTSVEGVSISSTDLERLTVNPIIDLFAAGLRATSPETKFLSWFAIVEEFVERNVSLNKKHKLLFNEDEQSVIKGWARLLGKKGDRIKGDLGLLAKRTKRNRAEKLCDLLHELGIPSVCRHRQNVTGAEPPIPITVELCESLTKDRNKLFHSGQGLDQMRVYTVLYPLACELLKRADVLVADLRT
jgi:hypothetical protein